MTHKIKPSLPKGMRDFLPAQVAKRRYIISTIQSVFEKYGFQPIETPVMENLDTLTGKYGEEGDKLLFKVLNSGDYLENADDNFLQEKNSRKLTPQISEKGLRYDLTVPLARYVVQNQNDIVFPFKRYHIAPVWRADRPQKGRYREFYQCDADVIGSNSLVNEVELAKIYAEVFNKLGINVSIKVNSRKILSGLLEHLHLAAKAPAIIAEIDKLDKIGKEKVLDNITALGADDEATDLIEKVLLQQDKASIDVVYNENVHFQQGINEIGYLKSFDIPHLEIDFSLARGLDYYTGCIFEVKALDYHIGSIGGGGRYDNLTEMFGKQDLTGVGISFGLDRIYDVLEALNKFPETLQTTTKLMFAHFDEVSLNFAFGLLEKVRSAGISAEVYPDVVKLNKQLKYANDKQIAYVCVIGENEVQTGILTLKNMRTGEQEKVKIDTLIEALDDYKPNY
jgi:histidyl-tRNA synthetase